LSADARSADGRAKQAFSAAALAPDGQAPWRLHPTISRKFSLPACKGSLAPEAAWTAYQVFSAVSVQPFMLFYFGARMSSQKHEDVGRRRARETAAEEPLLTLLPAVADLDLDG